MKIITDVLGQRQFGYVISELTNPDFPWFYLPSTAYPTGADISFHQAADASFSHVVLDNDFESPFCQMFLNMVLTIFDKADEDYETIGRMRLGLLPRTSRPFKHLPHVDYYEEHKTALICLSGNNGPTVFYKEKYVVGSDEIPEKFTKMKSVKPQANQVVFFDGLTFHSSTTPTTDVPRIMLNVNYK